MIGWQPLPNTTTTRHDGYKHNHNYYLGWIGVCYFDRCGVWGFFEWKFYK